MFAIVHPLLLMKAQIFRLFLTLSFYSVFFCFITFVLKGEFIYSEIIKAFFWPNKWWFTNTFIIMLLFSSFPYILLSKLNKITNTFLVLFLFIFLSVLPTAFANIPVNLFSRVIWFLYIFYLGAFIKNIFII